jgi:glycosyltransferase involved in cell wall biosynthesis
VFSTLDQLMPPLLTLERTDPDADVLVVTNMWPDEEKPVYGVFVKRQVDSLIEAGVRCDVLYIRGYRSPFAYPAAALRFALWSLTRRGRYRLVHVHAGETTLPARFLVGTPMLCSYCGDDLLGDPGEDGQKTRGSLARAWVIRQISRTLAGTITKSAEMETALPPRRQAVNSVVPNGVDERTFREFEDRAPARERFGFPDDEVVALFAATKPDIPRKRRPLAEAACADAAERLGRPVRLHVARDVKPDEMPALMNACDVLLHTSALEGSPNAVKEALMCNLPIVATPSGDIEELLDGVEPSFVCEPDAGVLGEAIAACTGKRSNGREVAQRLKAGNVAKRVIGIYDELGRAPRPAAAASDVTAKVT